MSFITNEGLFRISLVMSIVGAVCNIVLNYFLIPPFKSVGAIWAMIISFFVSNFLLDLCFRESRPNFGWMMKGIATFWKFHRAS
jgi:Na+-driven multidrug efflux pump